MRRPLPYVVLALLATAAPAAASFSPRADPPGTFEGPVARAACGPGSLPETALQGEVTAADRASGRSAKGYRCNLELVGRYQGEGASWVNPSTGHCAYMATHFPSPERSPGVQVLDVADPAHPVRTTNLTSPAMLGTWESLKISSRRGLLAGVAAWSPAGQGVGSFDVYDISGDCAHPKLLNALSGTDLTLPANTLGHEGDFSPDGRTYWATNAYTGLITAIDVTDPGHPHVLFTGVTGRGNHGFGLSADGNRLYLAEAGRLGSGALLTSLPDDLLIPNGLQIFDVSDIQARRPNPQIRELSHLFWTDGAAGQHVIPVSYDGHPYLVYVDEMLSGAARIIDVGDETQPRIVAKLKLEIQMPQYEALRKSDTTNPVLFGYDAHYCTVDRQTDPTALACGYFASGVRVFDIRDPHAPREIAYFNPPAQSDRTALDLPGSEHAVTLGDMRTDWCSSPPRFVGDELWVTCQDSGFMTLRFTNGAYPLPSGTTAALGLPGARRCASRRHFTIHLRRGLRAARVTVNGSSVRLLRGARLRAPVDLRGLPAGIVRVRITARTRAGRRVVQERTYRTCVSQR